jgi:hypothetical protein
MKALPGRSLRAKLVLTSVVLLVVMLAALAANSMRLLEDALIEQARVRGRLLAPMLNAALVVPVAQRDYATVRNILRESRTEDGLSYLVLLDKDGRTVAAEGWDVNRPLPALEDNASTADFKSDGRFDTQVPLVLAGQR